MPNRTYEVPPPWRSRPYINDYIMEAAWPMVRDYGSPFHTQLPSHRHNFTRPKCLNRDHFERAYRTVQAELTPRAALRACLPPPRSFLGRISHRLMVLIPMVPMVIYISKRTPIACKLVVT